MDIVIEKAYELMKKEYNRQRDENVSLRLRVAELEKEIKRLKEPRTTKAVKAPVKKEKVVVRKPGTVAERLKAVVDVESNKKKIGIVLAYLNIYKRFCKKEGLDFDSLYKERLNKSGKVKQSFLEVLRSKNLIEKFELFLDKC